MFFWAPFLGDGPWPSPTFPAPIFKPLARTRCLTRQKCVHPNYLPLHDVNYNSRTSGPRRRINWRQLGEKRSISSEFDRVIGARAYNYRFDNPTKIFGGRETRIC